VQAPTAAECSGGRRQQPAGACRFAVGDDRLLARAATFFFTVALLLGRNSKKINLFFGWSMPD
jgi:hypothetical protein